MFLEEHLDWIPLTLGVHSVRVMTTTKKDTMGTFEIVHSPFIYLLTRQYMKATILSCKLWIKTALLS